MRSAAHTIYELGDSGMIPGRGKSFFSSSKRADRLWALRKAPIH
jgi:hypothetical protein